MPTYLRKLILWKPWRFRRRRPATLIDRLPLRRMK